MDPPDHTKTRAIVSRAFSARVIPRIEPVLRAVTRKFVERLIPGRELDGVALTEPELVSFLFLLLSSAAA